LFLTQVIGVLSIAVFSFLFTFLLMKFLKSTIGIRVTENEENIGLDTVFFGINSYPSDN